MWSRAREAAAGTALTCGAALLIAGGFLGDGVVLVVGRVILGTGVGVGAGVGLSFLISAAAANSLRRHMVWNRRARS